MDQNVKSIFDINEEVFQEIKKEYVRPYQIMDQNEFNKVSLKHLNEMVLIDSKGKNGFKITDENHHFIEVVFAYLNRNMDDSKLIYNGGFKPIQLSLEKGLLLSGSFGIGKTLMLRFINKYARPFGLTGRFASARAIYETKKPDLINVVGSEKYGLFIDDLGEEPNLLVNYGSEETPVARLLKERTEAWETLAESPKLFISTNLKVRSSDSNLITLEKLYGGRIASRLYGACNVMYQRHTTDFRV